MTTKQEQSLFDEQEPQQNRRTRRRSTQRPVPQDHPKAPQKPKQEITTAQPQQAVATTRPTTLMEICAQAARDPNVDVAKMEKIMAMLRDEEARRAKVEFDAVMAEAQAEIKPVFAASWNPHTKSRYPNLEAISKVTDPVLRKHKLTTRYGMADSPIDGHYRVILDISHPCGHTERFFGDFPADTAGPKGGGNKNPVQGVGSTLSYARRYLKTLALDLIISGEDTDADIGDPITPEQVKQLRTMMADGGPDEKRACQVFSVDKLEDLPALRYPDFVSRINQYKANRSAA